MQSMIRSSVVMVVAALAGVAAAQDPEPPASTPVPTAVDPTPAPPPEPEIIDVIVPPDAPPEEAAPETGAEMPPGPPEMRRFGGFNGPDAPAPAEPAATPLPKLISFNFKGVPINTVLDYLAESTGYAVVRSVSVEGTVDVISPKPLSADDAIELITTILHQRGYAALRAGRSLTIVKRDDASRRNVPVRQGGDPEVIPMTDEIVTQIIPVRYSRAVELVENLKPLLPEYSVIAANQGANSIIITDSQMNVRRVAEIINALDKSFAEITTVRAFPLEYADAKATATLITSLFRVETTNTQNNRNGGTAFRGGGPRFGGGEQQAADPATAALQASSRVAAAADERTNTLVVAAPEAVFPAVEELLEQIDRSTDVLTEVRVFPLRFANASETATLITSVYAPASATTNTNNNRNGGQRVFQFGGFGGFQRGGGGNQQQAATGAQSERQRAETTVTAVADTRTNSVVVNASPGVLDQIGKMVQQLDRDPAGTKSVYVYSLKNARPEEVSTIIEQMFGSGSSSTSTTNTRQNNTTNRANNAATRNNNNATNTRNTGN